MNELQQSHNVFCDLVRSDVQRLRNNVPDEVAEDSWLVQCYLSCNAFEARYPSAKARSKALRDLAQLNSVTEEVRHRLASMKFTVIDPISQEMPSDY